MVSPIGLGRTEFFEALAAGRSGVRPVALFDAKQLGRENAAEVKGFVVRDHLTRAEAHRMGRCSAMALAAARMAMRDAHLAEDGLCRPRTAVVLGTTMGEADVVEALSRDWIVRGESSVRASLVPKVGASLLPIHVARAFGAEAAVLTLPGACAAGNYAIGVAADMIRYGRADVVITGAAELMRELQYSGFVRLAAMAPTRCQPFDLNRQGLILGEGAGVMILESEEHAARRGANLQAEVGGWGISCDAYHITRPHPDAAGSIAAMRRAIDDSLLSPDDVDFINAHGTGTRANDAAEARVVHEVFGDRRVPISSVKSMLGHCMGAASALEAVSCIMTIETGIYPPTINYETPDPECDVNVVANVAQRGPANVVVNNSLAFGGYNAVTCFAKPGFLPPPALRTRPPSARGAS